MKLTSTNTREYKGKTYKKYFIILPNKLVEKLGWKTGTELEADVKKDKLIIERD